MNAEITQARGLPESPIDLVRDQYGMSDYEMFLLFGTDSDTQRDILRQNPEWRQAVRDMEAYFGA